MSLSSADLLRPYQQEIARAITACIRSGSGRTFSVMLARKMGKNELSAHIEAHLLNLYRAAGGAAIKAAPTLRPQGLVSQRRLQRLLGNPLNRG